MSPNNHQKEGFYDILHTAIEYVCVFRSLGYQVSHCYMTKYLSIFGWWGSNLWQLSLSILDYRCFLQVYKTTNMHADVGNNIIYAYAQLPFDMITKLMTIAYICKKGEGKNTRRTQLSRICLCCLTWNMRDNFP